MHPITDKALKNTTGEIRMMQELKVGQQIRIGDTYYVVGVKRFKTPGRMVRISATLKRIGYTTEEITKRLFERKRITDKKPTSKK